MPKPENNISQTDTVQNPFRCIQLAPCLFPGIILGTQTLKSSGFPCITGFVIKFRASGLIITKSFSNPLFTTNTQAKLSTCNAVCAYIVRNIMTELQQLNSVGVQWNSKSEGDQFENKDSMSKDDIPDTDGIRIIPEGE